MENKTDRICLSAGWVMNHLIISAMRYDASRSSYIVSDLEDIALLVHSKRRQFNPERVAWLACDLRETATDRLQGLDNVYAISKYNGKARFDAYTLIAKHLEQHPEMRFCEYDWEVDCVSGEVFADKRGEPLTYLSSNRGLTLYDCDIATIVTAANILDTSRHCIVKTDFEGKTQRTLCFESILARNILDEKGRATDDYYYTSIYSPVERPSSWMVKKYITSVEKE